MILDSHHHFWKYDPVAYGGISDRMSCIRRDFLPGDLKREIAGAGIDGVVTVQARQSVEETEWLLGFAAQHEFIRGVVGWVPLIEAQVGVCLEKFAADSKLKAVRHVVHDEPDATFILRPDFNRGVALLRRFKLAYDILIFERHLPQTIAFVDQHPDQVFVVDHIAKPRIGQKEMEPWRSLIRELALRPQVYCKLSGMVTEADFNDWSVAQLEPYAETVLDAFTPRRVMFGSDWPVCLVACGYKRWKEVVEGFCSRLTADERACVFGGTATEAYNL